MCEKKSLSEIVKDVLDGSMSSLDSFIKTIDKMETKIKKRHFLFIVGPNGAIEMKDLTKKEPEQPKPENTTCPHCKGDGYIRCEDCKGDGYIIQRAGLGQKNDVIECEICEGVGDVICPVCKGSGKTIKTINKEVVNTSIINFFNEQKHKTVIGDFNIGIVKIQHDPNFIYVFPAINDSGLVKDVKFDEGLKIMAQGLKCNPIIIPDIYYKTV